MKKRLKLILLMAAMLLVNATTWLVTTQNQKDGLYPIDADSIGLPIAATVFVSLLLLPALFFISIPSQYLSMWLRSENRICRIAVRSGFLLFYLIGFLFSIYGFVYWNFPEHYSISVSYLALLLAIVVCLSVDIVSLSKS